MSGNGWEIWGIIAVCLWALIPGAIAKHKGRSFIAYWALSLIITPLIAMFIVIAQQNLKNDRNIIYTETELESLGRKSENEKKN